MHLLSRILLYSFLLLKFIAKKYGWTGTKNLTRYKDFLIVFVLSKPTNTHTNTLTHSSYSSFIFVKGFNFMTQNESEFLNKQWN
jgi:hypothetical protein